MSAKDEDKKRIGSSRLPENEEKDGRRVEKQFRGKQQKDGTVQFDKTTGTHHSTDDVDRQK